jgi:hypothetical protein
MSKKAHYDRRSDAQYEFDELAKNWVQLDSVQLDGLCLKLAVVTKKLTQDDPRRDTLQTIMGFADGYALRNG